MYIEGRIQSRKYTGKDGVERTAYEIIGNEMKMLGSKSENAGGQESQNQAPPVAPAGGGLSDDIPFMKFEAKLLG